MSAPLLLSLTYRGEEADRNAIDFYDVAQALIGFQRSLALTTHLVLNGEVITQAPSLKGATILAYPPAPGSWRFLTSVVFVGTTLFQLGTASPDTVIGHIVRSAYDYVISETLGFHVDFDSTLGKQYKELQDSNVTLPSLREPQLDSVIEKCEGAIIQMHRPIFQSKTALEGEILSYADKDLLNPRILNEKTYEYVRYTEESQLPEEVEGRVSSYNINTFKGRIYIASEQRPIPFMLAETARTIEHIQLITHSLTVNAQLKTASPAAISCTVYKYYSRTNRLKSLLITDVRS